MNGTLRGVTSGLAGLASLVFSVGGCHQHRSHDPNYQRQPMQQNERDALALWGGVFVAGGARTNSPGARFVGGQMVRKAMDEEPQHVQQNVYAHVYNEERFSNDVPSQDFPQQPYNKVFACLDINGNRRFDLGEERFMKNDFFLYEGVSFSIPIEGAGRKLRFYICDDKGNSAMLDSVPTSSNDIVSFTYSPGDLTPGKYNGSFIEGDFVIDSEQINVRE